MIGKLGYHSNNWAFFGKLICEWRTELLVHAMMPGAN